METSEDNGSDSTYRESTDFQEGALMLFSGAGILFCAVCL
jgi:hypothetical protein